MSEFSENKSQNLPNKEELKELFDTVNNWHLKPQTFIVDKSTYDYLLSFNKKYILCA